ncbi:Nuclear SAM-dependent mono-and asymmetric methyltransferase [Dimargaris cristalligena]|uniref:type I protein arginine methyltransferase n=1 Tax=Dimargaris cristalligena TaxID=215637 RepID=A0A4P9ZXB3_9FUNG|nr:Nuclear SAM-dependent mono-and asymmetric methyltransferase [Dimargaris cristalligena]RKP37661.1 protein arginine N-methyltransferase [Dimargaris cristalligena]|eukprot:RKP37661.1 protein arginine N-methyltransferase [Dimargaris cristalligena]
MASNSITPAKADLTSKDYYFDSYAHFGIHEEMLKDEVRTVSYQNAILQNKHLFEGKVVLDVGCGTGILSMFAAKAGAKLVIGVDMSNIIDKAKQIVADNGLSDKVTLLKGKMEEVVLPVDHVDIIISEWMGYFLLYESMLDTVLVARDKYLTPGGLIFPDTATMHIAAIEDGDYRKEKIDFWDDVYGFNMRAIKEVALKEPLVDTVDPEAINTTDCIFKTIDITTVTKEELAFTAPFHIQCTRRDYVHALLVWFDISFDACHKPVRFTTGPRGKYTHWKQTVFYLPEPLVTEAGEPITGEITSRPNDTNPRDIDITIKYRHEGEKETKEGALDYRMC